MLFLFCFIIFLKFCCPRVQAADAVLCQNGYGGDDGGDGGDGDDDGDDDGDGFITKENKKKINRKYK